MLVKKDETKNNALLGHLTKINDHLAQRGTRFLTGDTMCCFDCELMPRLQHIRVAGKYFVDFEIPVSLPFNCNAARVKRIWITPSTLMNHLFTAFVLFSCHFRIFHRLVFVEMFEIDISTLEECAFVWKRNTHNNNMTCEIECVTLEHVTRLSCVNI